MAVTRSDGESGSLDFIDFVFTTAVAIGLTPELLQVSHVTGLLSEPWVIATLKGSPMVPCGPEAVHFGSFMVGLLTLLLSWFGLHASLRAKRIGYDSVWGMLRFILDVTLVLVYGVVLIFFRRLLTVLFLLALIYVLYVVWDLFKTLEYRTDYWRSEVWRKQGQALVDCGARWPLHAGRTVAGAAYTFRRQLVSCVFAVSFVALWCIGYGLPLWITLCVAFALTFLYRISKLFPLPGVATTFVIWLAAGVASLVAR
jgi:hypothetical protein